MNIKTIQTPDKSVHEYVDLGLPSGTLWATENIKDTNGNELYFAWGETIGHTAAQVRDMEHVFEWFDYKFNPNDVLTKYNRSDNRNVLEPEDDAATQNWGAEWKMPSKAQFEELLEGTNQEWTEVNGIKGLLCTSKTNDNTVFFVTVGSAKSGNVFGVGSFGGYWSATMSDVDIDHAWYFYFDDGHHEMDHDDCCYGYSIRPVCV